MQFHERRREREREREKASGKKNQPRLYTYMCITLLAHGEKRDGVSQIDNKQRWCTAENLVVTKETL